MCTARSCPWAGLRTSIKLQTLQVVKETKALKKRQETPDSLEALASIPSLQLSDIPTEVATIPTDITSVGSTTVLTHDLFTADVLYADVALPLSQVPARLLPLLPLFCSSLTQMGTQTESFVELTERIDRTAGGLSISPMIAHKPGQVEPVSLLLLRGKAMGRKAEELFELMRDILLSARLDDQTRFKQMVLETKAGMEAGVIGGGHSFAAGRLSAQRGVAAWANEQMGGLDYLFYVRDLAKRVEQEWDSIRQDLETLRQVVLSTNVRSL
jgi:presequence protease